MPANHNGFTRRHRTAIRRLLITVLALALLGTTFFAVRLTTATAVWTDPARQFEPIAGWMTPRYVAMSWQVPPEVVGAALSLEQDGMGRKITLAELADLRGVPLHSLTGDLTTAIAAYRAQHP
ncbi:hypothetical protein [Yoonia sp.]|jgi:hypothetical protein|uniref:hypothetical protein n=1 Tax=Yoonia sp. TaxID=2212373 RepID=UPI0025E6EB6C|nr:hypothetical protein [Yoonia sp.]